MPLSFDDLTTSFSFAARRSVAVTVNGTKYLMVEYGGNELAEDQQEKFAGVTLDKDGKPAMMQTSMDPVAVVARCLHYTKDGDTPGAKVPRIVIGAWPGSVVKGLEAVANRLNGGADDPKAGSPPATTAPGTE